MIKNFEQYNESIKDKMVGKPMEDVFTYDSFKPILRKFEDEEINPNQQGVNNLIILSEQLPILLDCKEEDLRYFLIKDGYTQTLDGKIIVADGYQDVLKEYTKDSDREIIKIPELDPSVITSVVVFKDKKIAIVHSPFATMFVLDKNIFDK